MTAAITSDDRFRGRSVSAGQPTASLDLSYDAANGAYAGLAVAGVATRSEGPQLLAVQEYAGYAKRLQAGGSLDFGVTHANYTEYYGGDGAAQYSEIYTGLITRRFATHVYYSPDYFGHGYATLYGEVDTAVRPARNLRLSAHAGVLSRLHGHHPAYVQPSQYDWRIGLATALRAFELEFTWSGAGPNRDYYEGRLRRRDGAAVTLRRRF